MEIRRIGKIGSGQDGAIWGNELFRFGSRGKCVVHDLTALGERKEDEELVIEPFASFTLDRAESIAPHSNAVCFGTEYYAPGDEFPLLYTNIYNNYGKDNDSMIGVCCVYRLQRTEDSFTTTLVQLIKIGFCDDVEHWRLSTECHGPRPYGNFLVDRDTGSYYAFVMKNEEKGCAYFRFDLPSVQEGEIDPEFGVKKVVLTLDSVREEFTCPYHHFIQGAIAHGGYIYSTEGFSNSVSNHPGIRVISLAEKQQASYFDLTLYGETIEPEMIDFYNGACYYSDAHGNFYTISFDDEDYRIH